jgi:hypothetical protein
MKALIEQYLSDQGIKEEFYSVQFLRFTTNLYRDEDNKYHLEFPVWRFACPKPEFTPQEIENACSMELRDSLIDGINNKLSGQEATDKIDELNALTDLEDIKSFTY